MVYTVDNCGVKPVEPSENILTDKRIIVGCVSLSDFEPLCTKWGFPDMCLEACKANHRRFHNNVEVYDHFSYFFLRLLDVSCVRRERRETAVFIKKNVFLLVPLSDSDSFEQDFEKAIEHMEESFTVERLISRLFLQWIEGSSQVVEECERQVLTMEESIWANKIGPDFNRILLRMKNNLIIRQEFYDELIAVAETIQADDNNLFTDESFRHLKIAVKKLQRFGEKTRMLCEGLVHVREAYQSAMDYRLNQIMKIFTVITAIFLPLSLVASWYGMNFVNMPELTWKYGYAGVAIISVVIVVVSIWIFKRKKWL